MFSVTVRDCRPDRDQYIEIQTQNILPGRIENFAKKSSHEINSLGQPYDLQSIMHYKQVNGFYTQLIRSGIYTQAFEWVRLRSLWVYLQSTESFTAQKNEKFN